MASKGGNPFLMDDYPEEPDSAQQTSNPFLQDFGNANAAAAPTTGAENPFFNFTAEPTTYQPPPAGSDSTNPFAFFAAEESEPAPPAFPEETTQSSEVFGAGNHGNFFGIEVEPAAEDLPPPPAEQDLFATDDSPKSITAETPAPEIFGQPSETPVVQAMPTKNGKPNPARPPPPPPRPHPPLPPKHTKDLILSVTGAMDATSNHLLDRLQATRTPSPTLLHSPSPTPEHSFADLLDVDSNVPDLIPDELRHVEAPKNQDIMDLFDAPNSQSSAIFTGPDITVDSSAQLVSGTDDSEVSSIIDGAAMNQENPFADEPHIERKQSDFGIVSSGFDDIPDAENAALDNEVAAFPVPDTSGSAAEPETSSYDFNEDSTAAHHASDETFAQPSAESNFFTDPEPTSQIHAAVEPPVFAQSAPMGIFDAEPIYPEVQNDQTIPSSGDIFGSDLLADFSRPADDVNDLIMPTSPAPAAEFPVANAYRADEMDSFAATTRAIESTGDAFDAFASKFDKAAEPEPANDPFFDAFGGGQPAMDTSSNVWGDTTTAAPQMAESGFGESAGSGFGESEGFDSFLSMTAPPQEPKLGRRDSGDSDEAPDFSVFIKPREGDQAQILEGGPVPVLAPPPKSPINSAYNDSSPRFNPFDKSAGFAQEAVLPTEGAYTGELARTDSQETPPTPLFDEDTSQPLEDFPRVTYTGDGWEMQLRHPNKKKITGQRYWKKIFVRLVYQGENPVLQLSNSKDDKDPFQELPLLACYSVSDIAAQQFDQYGKIFTVKLQYIFYKERPGVRPGQVTKAERLTNKLSQFAAYAIQGDYQGVKEFGSDLKKLGLPVEHAPQISQLFKLGSQHYEDTKQFSCAIEEALFRLSAHRDRALTYKMEEVQISVVDELYVEQNAEGAVEKQIARVRLFFLGFLTGMPDVELGINDMWRQGKEVVGRHDIIPVVTEEWIRLESVEFHSCVQQDEYERSRIIKFKPPDACYIELMRFRVRPPKNRELPLQLKAVMCVTGNKVVLTADILVPGFASRKLGQVPCEDVVIRFPIPECWIYLFRVEKHFRYGSVKSAHRRTGKIKGIERFLGAVDTLEPQLMEVTSGQAKYEHQHRAIVWRMPRLPKEGQGAYTTHGLVCRMELTSYDQIPEKLAEYAYVEFTMPATQVSHTTARSVSLQNSDSDNPPEKYVRNLSRHEYRVGIEHTQGEGPGAYVAATKKIPEATPEVHEEVPEAAPAESDSDSSE